MQFLIVRIIKKGAETMKKTTAILLIISFILLLQVFNQRLQLSVLQAENIELLEMVDSYTASPDENF